MELWIRSQDKIKLFKCDSLAITEMEGLGKYCICDNFEGNIAECKTKERALEVLDKIQSILYDEDRIEKFAKAGITMNNLYPVYVYEMPEE